MNDGRALKALNFQDIADIDDDQNWATILASQVSFDKSLRIVSNLILVALPRSRAGEYKIPYNRSNGNGKVKIRYK